jgi:hypothetical protein
MAVPFDKLLREDETREDRLARARELLRRRRRPQTTWPTLAAAAFFAVSALTLASSALVAPVIAAPAHQAAPR